MPDIDKILAGKETKVPEGLDILWALSTAITYRAKLEHLDNIFDYINNFPKEFEVLIILSLIDKDNKFRTAVASSPKWSKWIETNKELLKYDEN